MTTFVYKYILKKLTMKVIITGAGKGIGYELAKIFSNEKRAEIFIISRSEGKLNILKDECLRINNGASIHTIAANLTSDDDFSDVINKIGRGHIDILVNNAGLLINKKYEDFNAAEVQALIQTNFIMPARLIAALLPEMGGTLPTHVVNIGSMGGFQGSFKFPGLSYYSASKAALANLTECLATEFKDSNIIFNCLAFGSVKTEMFSDAFPGFEARLTAMQAAEFIYNFAVKGYNYFNGKILPVSVSTP